MKSKKSTMAALAALFIAGSAGFANAESGLSTAASDEGSSASMQASHSYAGTHAYGYVWHHAPIHKARLHRSY